jgi:hypothetical protein
MTYIAFKIFVTCAVIFGACAVIEDIIRPSGMSWTAIKMVGGAAVIIGFFSLIVSVLSYIWNF